MKIDDWLKNTERQLDNAGIGTARLDCLVLLEDIINKDRSHLLAHPEMEISPNKLKRLNHQVALRLQHVPLAQIRGKTEFYGREFIINEHVLEPRPESETMIDLLLELPIKKGAEIIDVGTGSGALGITAKLHLTDTEVTLIDIDPVCLEVAKRNIKKHSVQVKVLQNDLLENLYVINTVLANLPYVPKNFEINRAALNEPALAIFGGEDGLDVYRQLFEQINNSKYKPLYLCCESLPFQHKALKAVAQKAGYKQLKEADFIQVFQKS